MVGKSSTGYGWEGLGQVCVTLLGARHVPGRLCSGLVYLGRYNKCSPLSFFIIAIWSCRRCWCQVVCGGSVSGSLHDGRLTDIDVLSLH